MARLLIVKTSSLGDVVHNLPVVTDILAHFPDMEISWAVEQAFADIPSLHPGVKHIIPVALRRWRRSLSSAATRAEIQDCKQQLQAAPFDFILDTQGLLKSALVASWAQGPRYGYNWTSAREPLAALTYQRRYAVPRSQHAVQRNRQLAALALNYPVPTTPPEYGIRARKLALPGVPQKYVVGLHGTSRASKLWPMDYWIGLSDEMGKHGCCLLLPWGNQEELARAEQIAAESAATQVLPPLRISQLASLLIGAKAAVGVDTGLMHLAAALDVPTLAIYTDTDPARTGVLGYEIERTINIGGKNDTPACEPATNLLLQLMQRFPR